MFVIERKVKGRWCETARLPANPIERLSRLPKPHLRRVIDLTTGGVWAWRDARQGYQLQKAEVFRG